MADVDCERADLLIGLLGDLGETGDADAGALTPAERAEAEAHVASCPSCREALAAYRAISGALRELPVETPSAAGTARAYAAVVEAMAVGASGAAPSIRLLGGGGGAARARQGEARRRPGLWLQGLAAAACVLIVATLAFRRQDDRQQARVADGTRQDVAPAQEQKSAAPAPSAQPAPRVALDRPEEAARSGELTAPAAPQGGGAPIGDAASVAQERAEASAREADGMEKQEREGEASAPSAANDGEGAGAAGEALGRSDDDARRLGGALQPERPPSAPPARPQAAAAEPLDSVIAAWRVGDRVVVLERAGDAVVAYDGALALLDAATRQRGAASPSSAAGPGAPPPPAEEPAEGSAQLADVAPLPSSVAEPLRAQAARGARAGTGSNLDADLRTILAAELARTRDAAWTTRVAALLRALGEPAPDAEGAAPDQLAARARRHLAATERAPTDDR